MQNSFLFTADLTERQGVATRLLANGIQQERLAHALLLTGRAHQDKWLIARQLAAYLNCEKEDKAIVGACMRQWQATCVDEDGSALTELDQSVQKGLANACQNCRWLFQDEHPKAWLVLSAEAGKSGKIPVEAARNLSEELARTSHYVRVVIVEEANEAAFHRPAANALLKTIEEPKSPSLFLLFSQTADDVLTTIVSRCQVVPLNNRIEENIGPISRIVGFSAERASASSAAVNGKRQSVIQELTEKLAGHLFVQKLRASSKDALALSAALQVLIDDDYEPDAIIDSLIALELKAIGAAKLSQLNASSYLVKLLKLSEDAKRQIDQYVSKKGVCESFVLTWLDLRQNFNSH
jgi:hypothetical protein